MGQWQEIEFAFTATGSQARIVFHNFSDGEFIAWADSFEVVQLLESRNARQRLAQYDLFMPLVLAPQPSDGLSRAEIARLAEEWELARAAGLNPKLPRAVAEAYRVYDNAAQPRLARTSRNSRQATATNGTRTIDYDYDSLYRLTAADYSTGEAYSYQYDPVGNRLQQVINGDTTAYTYDAANRLTRINGLSLSYDNNGNRLTSNESQSYVWDAANRLTSATPTDGNTITTVYDGLGNRVSQTAEGVTTNYALDTAIGLAEVIFTSAGHSYLHLPGVLMTESATGETRYLLADGLGSIRHVTDGARWLALKSSTRMAIQSSVVNHQSKIATATPGSGGRRISVCSI